MSAEADAGFNPRLSTRNVGSGTLATIHRGDGTSVDFWGPTPERARSKANQYEEAGQ